MRVFHSDLAGHDLNFMAISGLLASNKDENGNVVMPPFQVADLFGGTEQIISSVLLGIIQRTNTGVGDWFDISITEASLSMNALLAPPIWYNEAEQAMDVLGGKLPNYSIYKCKDDKFIVLAGLEEKFWQNICDVLDKPEWKSENLVSLKFKPEIKEELNKIFLTKTRDEWTIFFGGTEVCFSQVLEFEETLHNDHLKEKNSFIISEKSELPIGFGLGIKKIGKV